MQPSTNPAPNPTVPPVPAVPPVAQPQAPVAQQSGQNAAPAPNAAAANSPATPALADDGDLIEKEWVAQVKKIVHATAHDPYELTKQFSQLKAEYMQKRYGKVIKSED